MTRRHNRGQSAVELAVFGGLVIFVIGLILRSSLSMSHSANISLRVFRMALQESYKTGEGLYTDAKFSSGRNVASILLIEDRLSVDPSQKQGTRDRSPYMAQGSGTMTHALFMSAAPEDVEDLPVTDMIINGQRFPLLTNAYVTKNLQELRDIGDIVDCNADGYGTSTGVCFNPATSQYSFFQKVDNGQTGWCHQGCDAAWPADRRFDLNFDGETDVSATEVFSYGGLSVPLRQIFSWQWVLVPESELEEDKAMRVDMDGDWKEELVHKINRDPATGLLVSLTVTDSQDGDIDNTSDDSTREWWTARRYRHILLGWDDPGPLRMPGLQQEFVVYSFTKDGTLLQNREGRLYTHDGQFVRNATRQEHLDIIERVLYLSGNTGRFCSIGGGGAPCPAATGNCLPTVWGNTDYAGRTGLKGLQNPVEACGDCFSVPKNKSTCMDITTRGGPTILVRSRIRDRRRSRWITRIAK